MEKMRTKMLGRQEAEALSEKMRHEAGQREEYKT